MRPDKDSYFLRHAVVAAQMSTCVRRAVGCVVTNQRHQILGVGFNGVPAGMPHCNEGNPCPGASAPSGTKLTECYAAHAEVNAVIQCRDPYSIDTVYTTTSPCVDCTKFLLNTSAKRVVFIEEYPQPVSKSFWEMAGRLWVHKPEGARGRWVADEPARPLERVVKKAPPLSAVVQARLAALKKEFLICRAGGYVGRLKAGLLLREIKEIEEKISDEKKENV